MRRRAAAARVATAARVGFGVIVGFGVVAGLGAGPAVAASAARPCTVLTRPEITAVFGQPAGKGSDDLGPTFCQWNLGITDDRAPGQVNALVEHGKAAKRDFKLAAALPDAEPVDGLGRRALFVPSSGTLWVLVPGSTLFYVQANLYADATTRITDGVKDGLVQLATRAEARV